MAVKDPYPVVIHPYTRNEETLPAMATPSELLATTGPWPVVTGAGSESLERALLQALRRRWPLALGLGLVTGALGAALAWFALPPKYTAQAVLHVSSQPIRGIFSSQEGTEDFLAYQRTQAVIIKSREVLQAALRQPAVAERRQIREQNQPVQWVAENLKVDSKQGAELLNVSLIGDYPDDLPLIVNAVLQAYLQELASKERLKQPARVEQLQENYRRLEDALRRKRSALRELETSLGVDPPHVVALRYQSALNQQAVLEKETLQAKIALKNAQLELGILKQKENDPKAVLESDLSTEPLLTQDPGYQVLLLRKAQLEQEAHNIRTIAAAGTRERMLTDQMNQIAVTDRELAAKRKVLQPVLLAQKRAKLETQTSVLEGQHQEMTAELKRQEDEVKRLAAAVRYPDRPTSDLEGLRDEVAQAEQVLKKVGEQRDMMKVEPALPARASVLENADVPQSMDVRRQGKVAGMAGLALFGFTVMGVCLREYRSRRVHGEEDVVRSLGMKLIGTLPAPSGRPRLTGRDARGRTLDRTLLTVSVDVIREKLLEDGGRDDARVFMITSATADEGKSLLAAQLAASLARTGCRVLLLDADVLDPGIHHQFSLPGAPGFSEVLSGDVKIADAECRTAVHGLWLMPLGQWSEEASTVLARERGQLIFELLKGRFDFVVVHAGPVLAAPDALLFGRRADSVIFSVQYDLSQIPLVQEAHQHLAKLGVPVLGTVVTGIGGAAC